MSHRHHLVYAVAAMGLAVWLLATGGGGAALAGVNLALLICPLVMGFVMWLLMRQPPATGRQSETEPHDDHAPAGQR